MVTDLKTFAAGTIMELEYARQLGMYIIVVCNTDDLRNIFLMSYASKIINNINKLEELETTLREIIE
jgi:hypothetical protein